MTPQLLKGVNIRKQAFDSDISFSLYEDSGSRFRRDFIQVGTIEKSNK
jgi:hypothetical protein